DVTQRKENEAAFQRYVSTIDAIPDAIYVVDRSSMSFIHINDAACLWENKTREQLCALGPMGLNAVARADLERVYDAIIASGQPANPVEVLRPRVDGSMACIEVRRQAQCFGGQWTIITLARDISARKQAETALTNSEIRLRALIENSSDIIAITTIDGVVQYISSSVRAIAGYEPGDLVGRSFKDMVHPDDLGIATAQIDEASGVPGSAVRRERRYRHKDGSWIDAEVIAVNLLHEPAIAGIVSTIRDITQRKRAADELRDSEEKFRQLADHVNDVFYVFSADLQQVHYASPAYEQIWGHSRASLYANPLKWGEAILPEERAAVFAAFGRLATERSMEVEFRIARPDGAVRWILSRGFQVRDAAGTVIRISGIASDITERKVAAEVLAKRALELERFNRLSVGRELQMIELKKQVNQLASLAGQKPPHELAFLETRPDKVHSGDGPAH
ncbi:MAG: PAS domain S-box protein, partial [Pseudomonadota bacterium]|nr:PAS domain S-box protein [Pseudomonadota bacterium]